ncbi:MAG: hypothetical protein ACK5V2_09030 [Pseudomonadota bacterium]|jgi:hypothetical protein
MPIIQGLVSSFKLESWQAIHDFPTDTLKFALYTANASLNPTTTTYASANEVTAAGYTAGGVVLSGVTLTLNNGAACLSFDNPTWAGVNFVCRGALIYNASKANRAIAVLDFGADKTASGTFVVPIPANTSSTAIIRFQ